MTDAANQLAQLRQERDRFLAFAFTSADMLIELDSEGTMLFADGATSQLIGEQADRLIGKNFYDLLPEQERESTRHAFNNLSYQQRLEEMRMKLRHGKQLAEQLFSVSGYRLPYRKDHLYLTFRLMQEELRPQLPIGDQARAKQESRFSHRLLEVMQRAGLKGDILSLVLLDIPLLNENKEKLKELDRAIIGLLQQAAYATDAAGEWERGVYALLLPEGAVLEAVIQKLEKLIVEHIGESAEIQSSLVHLQESGLQDQDAAKAIHYTINEFARSRGENFTLTSLREGYQNMMDETVMKMNAYKTIIAQEDYTIAFQPVVGVDQGDTHHYEVLTRLHNNDIFENPYQFIRFGEEAGLIEDFDYRMCLRVLKLLETTAKLERHPILAVNLSGRSISNVAFRDQLFSLLRNYSGISRQVIFEITESAKIEDMPTVNSFLQELRGQGNLCCLDDFGVGESSFEYIRHLDVDYVKIDGSYVRDSMVSPRGRHLLRAMVNLCHNLDISVIGEMVEDQEMATFLRQCHVELGQGYHYGRPTTEVDALLKAWPVTKKDAGHPPVMTKHGTPMKVPNHWKKQLPLRS